MSGVLLAFDTSQRRGSIALGHVHESGTDEQEHIALDRSHASDLLPAIDAMLRRARVARSDLKAIVVGRGPGSYTGLRVGAATALGLSLGLGTPIIGLSSTEALAAELLVDVERVTIVLDARRGSFFVARYERQRSRIRPGVILSPALRAGIDLVSTIPEKEPVWCDCPPLLRESLPSTRFPRVRQDLAAPAAVHLLRIAREILHRGEEGAFSDHHPLYLRASSPEERFKELSGP